METKTTFLKLEYTLQAASMIHLVLSVSSEKGGGSEKSLW